MSAWKSWERRVARDLGGERNLEESRSGGCEDVVGHGLPFAVQAKHGQRPRIYDAVRQAEEAADGTDRLAVAAVMRSHGKGRASERLAVLPWPHFLSLVERLEADGGG